MTTHLFISYVPEDRSCFHSLEGHLRPLHAQGRITYWHMGMVPAGIDWRSWRREHMDRAQVILCLVSADYLAQAQQEIDEVRQRQRVGAQVIPVLVRPVMLEGTLFEALQPLPASGTPISMWKHQDQVILAVVKGILGAITALSVAQQSETPAAMPASQGQTATQPKAPPPVGTTYEIQKPVQPLVPADFPRPVNVSSGRVAGPTENTKVPPQEPFVPTFIRALFLAAVPEGASLAKLDEEAREIDQIIHRSQGVRLESRLRPQYNDLLQLKTALAVRKRDLPPLLMQYRPHILHFSGHGTTASQIVLTDDQGREAMLSGDTLMRLLSVLPDNLKGAVFNICYSDGLAEPLLRARDCPIAFAVGMKGEISAKTAVLFSAGFYQALAFGRSLAEAYHLGVLEAELAGQSDFAVPQLFCRIDVDPKQMCLVRCQDQPFYERPP